MLSEYVDGTVEATVCQELEHHLKECHPCQVVVDNVRQTVTLYKAGQPYELPAACRERLHSLLRERWKQTHPPRPDTEAPARDSRN